MKIQFVCTTCGDDLDVERDGEWIDYGERHDCWGDRATIVAMVDEQRIKITDERVQIQLRQ